MGEVGALAAIFRLPRFGAAWQAIEQASPRLQRQPVAMHELAALISEATDRLADHRRAARLSSLAERSSDLGELAAA
jgi:hypothetical protein